MKEPKAEKIGTLLKGIDGFDHYYLLKFTSEQSNIEVTRWAIDRCYSDCAPGGLFCNQVSVMAKPGFDNLQFILIVHYRYDV